MLVCTRCGLELAGPVRSIDRSLALAIAGLLLLVPATTLPLMSLISFGMQRSDWLPTGVTALWSGGFSLLAAVILLFSIVIPFVYLGLLVYVLGGIRLGARDRLRRPFHWAEELQPWAMVEVYLVGCCVAYTRLQDVGNVHVEAGGWCLMAAAFAAQLAIISLDEHAVWAALRSGREAAPRKPEALKRTQALVIAGFLLYVPANLLPVLSIERFGREEPNTILSGVRELVVAGQWPLAVIVFAASIVVPLGKLVGLSLMLTMTYRGSRRWLIARTRLYRFIDFIGRWSSIDLFMISILVALVQFGTLTQVRAEGGALAFAAVVVVTMFASRCFDPRAMWDAAVERL